jgi:hypothetical protein
MSRKLIVGAVLALSVVVGLASPSFAAHVHSKELGNGSCVLLAQGGGEKYVELPAATGYDPALVPEDRRHPLHLLVHLGRAGEDFTIGVYGTASDPCLTSGNYVND